MKKRAKTSYTNSILIVILIMAIFTEEYVTIASIITTLLMISLNLLFKKIRKPKTTQTSEQYNNNIKIGFYLSVFNIIYFIMVLSYYRLI